MANRPSRSRLLVLALAAAGLLAATRAEASTPASPAPAPGPSADCTDALLGLAGCLGYVQEGSTAAAPDPSCCSGLRDVVRGEVACLCQLFQGGQDFGLSLNMTRALQLPAACKVKTPPVSKCHVSVPGVPSASPVPAPSSGAPDFGQSPTPSPSTPSGSPAATGSQTSAPAPSPARSAAAGLSAPPRAFTFIAAATLLVYRVL
ncbi:xylogen protein 1 precursor [Zea mays]|uniref:Xylogen protein 1 n=1 Tax=Zea mays TaxID=4577 RepID=B6U254_MAIZE|nr:xylogen protein 1 precursor [Zea mays]ACG43437.1 xylogen protein 1 [Zea mays]|eukprot:NP_001151585.1 xylogen protein 1 precursor [Zea mays]